MSEPTILYVDELNKDEIVGGTSDPTIIRYNNKKLIATKEAEDEFTDLLGEEGGASHISAAGRYICVTNISLDKRSYTMVFMDLKKKVEKAKQVCEKFGEKQKASFMSMFYHMNKGYEKFYNKYKLVKGKPLVDEA